MAVTVDYTTTFEDYRAAQALYLRSRRWPGLRYKLWMYGLPTAAIVLTSCALWELYRGQPSSVAGFGGAAVYAIIMTIVVVFLRPWNLKRLYKKQRKTAGVEALNAVRFSFDESLVRSGYPGRSEGQFSWDAIGDYAEDKEIFLIFISKKMFLYIPKRAMADEQWNELRDMLQAKGKEYAC
jgi:uncharacterized membrane protein YhiD involved in acid resistance